MPPPTMITCIPRSLSANGSLSVPLVALDPRVTDDLAVALVVARDQFAKAIGPDKIEIVAERRQLLLHLGELGDLIKLAPDALGEIARRLGRRGDAEPDTDIESQYRILGHVL